MFYGTENYNGKIVKGADTPIHNNLQIEDPNTYCDWDSIFLSGTLVA